MVAPEVTAPRPSFRAQTSETSQYTHNGQSTEVSGLGHVVFRLLFFFCEVHNKIFCSNIASVTVARKTHLARAWVRQVEQSATAQRGIFGSRPLRRPRPDFVPPPALVGVCDRLWATMRRSTFKCGFGPGLQVPFVVPGNGAICDDARYSASIAWGGVTCSLLLDLALRQPKSLPFLWMFFRPSKQSRAGCLAVRNCLCVWFRVFGKV